ncbi:MAG: hypothetical protein HY447_05370 [Candidatus Omnitrophica bacterium]|nr:hypothetical protein [Candidatus Omnitrophota bacterium]
MVGEVIRLEIPVYLIWDILLAWGMACTLFGIFTAVWPRRSIGFYQWIMRLINWQVSPIDEAREVKNTRRFGIYLVLLGIATLGALFFKIKGI